MITSEQYDILCSLTDALRTAELALHLSPGADTARNFVTAENEWEAFVIGIVAEASLSESTK